MTPIQADTSRPDDVIDAMRVRIASLEAQLKEKDEVEAAMRRSEARSAHFKQVLLAIRNVNQLIIRETDPQTLIQRACENLTETLGYHAAWIALLDVYEKSVTITAASGAVRFGLLSHSLETGVYPTCMRKALEHDETVVVDVPAIGCPDCPLAGQYAARSVLARRLAVGARTYGVLVVSVPTHFALDEEEQELFSEVAGDLAYALHNLELQNRRVALDREQAQLLDSMINAFAIHRSVFDDSGRFVSCRLEYINRAYERIMGVTLEEVKGKTIHEVWPGTEPAWVEHYAAVATTGVDRSFELFHQPTGRTYHCAAYRPWDTPERFCVVFEDITERKRAETVERETMDLLKYIVRNDPNAIAVYDRDLHYLAMSDRYLLDYNVQEESILGKHHYEVFPEMPQRWKDAHQRCLAGAVESNDDDQFERPDGTITYNRWECRPWRRSNGDIGGIITYTEVTTERKLAEKALRESEELWRSYVQHAPYAVFLADEAARYLQVNPEACRVTGYSESELLSMSIPDLLVPGTIAEGMKGFAQLATAEKVFLELGFTTKSGENRWWSVAAVKLSETRYLAFAGDITERKLAEEERDKFQRQIQEQAHQLEQVISAVPEGVLLLDTTGRVIMANPKATGDLFVLARAQVGERISRMGNCDLLELLGAPPTDLWHEARANGSIYEIIASPIAGDHGTDYWVLVLRDVTLEREAGQRALQSQRLAAVGQLAAGIAHDFNNILAIIKLQAQLALDAAVLPEGVGGRLGVIEEQAHQASNLVKQILDFSRQAVLERRPVALRPFLQELITLLEHTLPENIALELTSHVDEAIIDADPQRLQQAVINLALNARDAMAGGGRIVISLDRVAAPPPDLRPETLPTREATRWVRLMVADTGAGISPEVLPRVFDPFFSTKGPIKGSGLGLSQVHGIVKQHGGEIDVVSVVGVGTTFSIYLPELAGSSVVPRPPRVETTRGSGQTVLIVEDNRALREALVDSVEMLGYRTLNAGNGHLALEVLEKHREIALIMSDLVMPEMGGRELMQAAKRRGVTAPVVILSGHPLDEELTNLQALGMAGWLLKPVQIAQLAQMLSRALAGG